MKVSVAASLWKDERDREGKLGFYIGELLSTTIMHRLSFIVHSSYRSQDISGTYIESIDDY
jgi:hypothetical protein